MASISKNHSDSWIYPILEKIQAQDLWREDQSYPQIGGKFFYDGRDYLNLSSNDYLDFSKHSALVSKAIEVTNEFGTASSASRLVTGTLNLHHQLEKGLAEFMGCSQVLIYGAGYLANIGCLPILAGRGDQVFSDRFVHASLIDGIVLSRAEHHRFIHNDCEHLESLLIKASKKRKRSTRFLIVTESVFSMDGDFSPLKNLNQLADKYEAQIFIDEAHALGVFGKNGAGRVKEELPDGVSAISATMSKALGSYGGFIGGSEALRSLLVNRSRSFIFNTSLPPAVVASSLAAISILKSTENLGHTLLKRADTFRKLISDTGLNTMTSSSQIIPILVGDSKKTLSLSARLRDQGILAIPIRPPTVPVGTSRIRLSLTLAHSEEDLKNATQIIIQAAREENLI